jgi:hypothetical protein
MKLSARKKSNRTKSHPDKTKSNSKNWIVITRWMQNHTWAVFIILIGIASFRIVSTYTLFNNTADELPHIACGMQWLSKGVYHYEPQHPPLARVATAIGPYLAGVRGYNTSDVHMEGLAILFRDGHPDRNLALARLGILPFFWIAATVVYLWAKKYFEEPVPALAVLSFTFLPPILAHAGLATTDMALAALTGASFFCAIEWAERPTLWRSLLFGGITGLAVLSKFSALPFIAACFIAGFIYYLLAKQPGFHGLVGNIRQRFLPGTIAILVGLLAIWAGYRFSFGAVPFAPFRMPAPELYAGIHDVMQHNSQGHSAYLLGEHSQYGWWYYYFVVLLFKTPLPFLALFLYGIFAKQNKRVPGRHLALAFSLSILLFSLTSNINIGVRHILPVYIGLSIAAGVGAARMLERAQQSMAALGGSGILLAWMIFTSLAGHPDYLPYFNLLAGGAPERILVDSDLDWGQDEKRLVARLKQAGADHVAYTPFFSSDPIRQDFPAVTPFDAVNPSPGWNAANLTMLKSWRYGLYGSHPEIQLWADTIQPSEVIGKSIWLWYFPPQQTHSDRVLHSTIDIPHRRQ